MKLISDVLNLTRPLVGVDLETTGVNARVDAIVQIGLEVYVPGKPPTEYKTLVNPLIPIPPGATAVHGITNEMVRDAPTFKQLAANLAVSLVDCDFVGYSVRFDLEQLFEEFIRAAEPWNYNTARIICAFRLWQIAEGRKLTDAINRWLPTDGRDQAVIDALEQETGEVGKAHDALWDVKMASRVAAAQLDQTPSLPRDLDELHQLQWPGWFDAQGKLKWFDGELCFGFGQYRDKPLRVVPKPYIKDFILKKDFSELVKQTCLNALSGIYPTCPSNKS